MEPTISLLTPAKVAFYEEALAAWKEYQESGLHLTDEEVEEWCRRLEAGEDAELPEPHR